MKQFTLLLLCFLMIKANAQHNLTIKSFTLNPETIPYEGSTLNTVFDSVIEDGIKITGNFTSNYSLSNLPYSVDEYKINGVLVQAVFVSFFGQQGYNMDINQADALIEYVKQGGILIGSIENVSLETPSGSIVSALNYITNALLCNAVTVNSNWSVRLPNTGRAYHPNDGLLKLNANLAVSIRNTGSFQYVNGIPSENTIMYLGTPSSANCNPSVLDFIIPAYPKLGTQGVNNSCNIQGFAILSGECFGPLTAVPGYRVNSKLNKNYAQFIYDFLYDSVALTERYKWSNSKCNVNGNCPPNAATGYGNVGMQIPLIVTLPNYVVNTCPNRFIDITQFVSSSTPANAVLQWHKSPDHTDPQYLTPHAATSGTYYAFYYDTVDHCISNPSTAITIETRPCDSCTLNFQNVTAPIILTGLEPLSKGASYTNSFIWITSDISVDSMLTFNDCEVLITPNTKINVPTNAYFNITGSHLYTCENTWQGIVAKPFSFIKINEKLGAAHAKIPTFIEDAEIALTYDCDSAKATEIIDTLINISGTIFNRNNVAIHIKNVVKHLTSTPNYPIHIANNIFTSRQIPFVPTIKTWDELKVVSNNYYGTYPAAPPYYAQPYISDNYYPDTVIDAYLKNADTSGFSLNKPLAGIIAENIFAKKTNGELVSVVIGNGNGSDAYPNTNIFDNLQFGIRTDNANVIINNCSFQKPIGEGVGITANGNCVLNNGILNCINERKIQINKPSGKASNAFFNMNTAISVNNYNEVDISNCDIRSIQDYTNTNAPNGKMGIYSTNNAFNNIAIKHNKIYNIQNPIYHTGGLELGAVHFGHLNIDSNTIAKEMTALPLTNSYIKNAITANAFLFSSIGDDVPVICKDNKMFDCFNGIAMSGWRGKNLNILNNEIHLAEDLFIEPNNPHYGIKLQGGNGASLQYDDVTLQPIGNTNDNLIQDNKIYGYGTSSLLKNAGIWLAQQNNTNLGCNQVYNTDHGFKFEGANLLTKFMDNFIGSDNYYGLTLYNGGEIGKQGQESLITPFDPNTCTSNNSWIEDKNYWNGLNHFMTNTFNSDPNNSILVVRTGGYEKFNPDGSASALINSQKYGVGNGLLATSQPDGTDCDADRCDNHPYPKHVKKSIIELLEEIAAGTTTLPNDEPQQRLEVMQQQLYELVKKRPELAQNSTDIQQFIYDNQWSSLDFIYYAGYYASKGNMTMVNALLNYWTPTNSEQDNNYHTYYEWLVNMYNNPNWQPNLTDVLAMANKCPIKDGTIIYAARNLYNALTKEINKFDNACESSTNARGSKQQFEIIRLKQPKVKANNITTNQQITLYPNPTNGIVNVTSKQAGIKQIVVIDMLGKPIKTLILNNQLNTQFNTKGLQKGLFLIKATTVNNTIITQKLIVE